MDDVCGRYRDVYTASKPGDRLLAEFECIPMRHQAYTPLKPTRVAILRRFGQT